MGHHYTQDASAAGPRQGESSLLELLCVSAVGLVQETMSKVVGLSFFVLDDTGRTLLEPATPSLLCRRLRRDKEFSKICAASDRYGADQAFARQERVVYFCPCGLLRAVIPVFAHGKFLGGLYLGQVQCDNAPEKTPRLERLLETGGNRAASLNRQFRALIDATPTYDFSYFLYIADTLVRIVDAVTARETEQRVIVTALENDRALLKERVRQLERDLDIRESSLHYLKSRLNLEFMVNGLGSVASLAVIENAPRVNEMCVLFADHLRHSLAEEKDFAPLREEAAMIGGYLAMQKIRYGEALSYTVLVPEEASRCCVPVRVLLPLVENMLLIGLAARETGFAMSFSAVFEEDEITIRIESNVPASEGRGLTPGVLPAQSGFDADAVAASLVTARNRLKNLTGIRHDLRFVDSPGGSACILRFSLPHLDGGDA